MVAIQAHNLKVEGSIPSPATNYRPLAQLDRAPVFETGSCRIVPCVDDQNYKIIKREGEEIMTVTRENLIRKLSDRSGYHMKDIREVLSCMDEVVLEELCGVTPDDEVAVQIVQGVKLICGPVEERERKDPRNQNDIVCKATCKVPISVRQSFL